MAPRMYAINCRTPSGGAGGCVAALVARLPRAALALVLSFVLTRLRGRTVIGLLGALSSPLARPIWLLTYILRLITHDSLPIASLCLISTWHARCAPLRSRPRNVTVGCAGELCLSPSRALTRRYVPTETGSCSYVAWARRAAGGSYSSPRRCGSHIDQEVAPHATRIAIVTSRLQFLHVLLHPGALHQLDDGDRARAGLPTPPEATSGIR
jgi:hypothetical protein